MPLPAKYTNVVCATIPLAAPAFHLGTVLRCGGPVSEISSFSALGGTSVTAAGVVYELRRADRWVLEVELLLSRKHETLAELSRHMRPHVEHVGGGRGGGGAGGGGGRKGQDLAVPSIQEAAPSAGEDMALVLDGWGFRAGDDEAGGEGEAVGVGSKRASAAAFGPAAPSHIPDAAALPAGAAPAAELWWAIGRASTLLARGSSSDTCHFEPIAAAGNGASPGRVGLAACWRFELGQCIDASPLLLCRGGAHGSAAPSPTASISCVVGSHSGLLAAVDLSFGTLLWRTWLPSRLEASPGVSSCGTLVFVGGHDQHLHAVRATDGARVWSRRAAGPIKAGVVCLPRQHGGAVISACGGGHVVALDAQSGRPLWMARCEGPVFATPALDPRRRRLYVADQRGCLHAWSYATEAEAAEGEAAAAEPALGEAAVGAYTLQMELAWQFRTAARLAPAAGCEPIFSGPAVVPSMGEVLFGCVNGLLYAVGLCGAALWTFDAGGPIFSAPCLAALDDAPDEGGTGRAGGCGPRTIHALLTSRCDRVAPADGRLFCVRARDGVLRWSRRGLFRGHASPASDACCAAPDGEGARMARLVCAASDDGTVHVFRAADGAPLGARRLPGAVFSSPAVAAGHVVVGCRDNGLHCLSLCLDDLPRACVYE